MCGFIAVFQRNSSIDERVFSEALNTLSHRGPDHTGLLVDSIETGAGQVHAGLGHCRLAIVDLDPRSNQPFTDQDCHLVYNGEIYNFRGLRGQYGDPSSYRTDCDTELLHRVILRQGDRSFDDFNGMWSFCFFDKRKKTVLLSRDRYGKKPLFYYQDQQILVFASEIKAILAYLGTRPSMRPSKVASFLGFGLSYADPGQQTYFSDINEVAAGCSLEIDLEAWTLVKRRWHSFSESIDKASGSLKENIENAVLSRLNSDRPVGLLLSGGIDSSLILSVLAAHNLHESVHCFIGQTGSNFSDDAIYARLCAQKVGINAIEIESEFGSNAFDRIMSMCWHHEKPFPLTGNSVAMHEMYSHIAEHNIPVVLDGTGGDEVFGGYWDRYLVFAMRDAIARGDVNWLARLMTAAGDDEEQKNLVLSALRRLKEGDAPTLVSGLPRLYGRAEFTRTAAADPLDGFQGNLVDAMRIDAGEGRLAEWISHNDRNAMAFGIENRSPFLDKSLIPMIGASYADKFDGPWNKARLRGLFSDFVELPTQWRRQKQGFRWPSTELLKAHKGRIMELITAGKSVVDEHIDVARFIDDANANDAIFLSDLTSRLFAVTAVAERFGASA